VISLAISGLLFLAFAALLNLVSNLCEIGFGMAADVKSSLALAHEAKSKARDAARQGNSTITK
jgi:hypothetical protein